MNVLEINWTRAVSIHTAGNRKNLPFLYDHAGKWIKSDRLSGLDNGKGLGTNPYSWSLGDSSLVGFNSVGGKKVTTDTI